MTEILQTGGPKNDVNSEITEVINKRFYAVLRVRTNKNTVLVLQNRDSMELINTELDWDDYLKRYAAILTEEGSEKLLNRLSSSALIYEAESGNSSFAIEVSYIKENRTNWVTISVVLSKEDGEWNADMFVWPSNEEHLLHNIITVYVYNTCDYFVYLDINDNSFIVFGSNTLEKKRLMECSTDYMEAMIEYANRYVVPEDREMTIRKMDINYVVKQLERNNAYSFTTGVDDPERGYTRKQLTFRYYDRRGGKILLSRTDVTEIFLEERARQKELEAARQLAETDPLTGILNYGGMSRQAGELLEKRSGMCAMLILDIDDFKKVNDTLGHLEGDRLLWKVAQTVQMLSGSNSIQGRVGGDEFVVFMYDLKDRKRAEDCAKQICEAVNSLSLPERSPRSVSCSIGVAFAPEEGEDYQTLFRRADQRVYTAKRLGKNRYLVSDEELT